jgi:hypothetical protein
MNTTSNVKQKPFTFFQQQNGGLMLLLLFLTFFFFFFKYYDPFPFQVNSSSFSFLPVTVGDFPLWRQVPKLS